VISCCGVTLPLLEAEEADDDHAVTVERVEDEHFVVIPHEMSKSHYISFLAYVTTDRLQLVKLYPEGGAQCRFPRRGRGILYSYCTHHGLMKQRL
jgi:desulfoferrodoxin (superoxide reductase-like protein)